jgi:site-specific DNA recombinase
MAPKCVIYTRVSTGEQTQNTSLVFQYAACKKKVEEIGGEVVAYYEDGGTSAALYETREMLQQALADIESGIADTLVCYDLSRYSRDVEHQSKIAKRVKTAGGRLVFCTIEYSDTADGSIMFGISGLFAQHERLKFRERSWNGRISQVKNGIQTQRSAPPYGYQVVTNQDVIRGTHTKEQVGKYEVIEEQAEIVRLIFQRYAAGDSLRKLCKFLQDKGIDTPKGNRADSKMPGRYWLASTLKSIMSNQCHIGQATFGKTKTVMDETRLQKGFKRGFYRVNVPPSQWQYIDCPSIIDRHLWEFCNERMKDAKKRHAGAPERKYMLTGILHCAKCMRTMMANKRRRHYHRDSDKEWVYRCKNSTKHGVAQGYICNPKFYKGQIIEAQVIRAIEQLAANPAWLEQAYRDFQQSLNVEYTEAEYQAIKKQLAELDKKESTTAQAQVEGLAIGVRSAVYEQMFRDINKGRAELTAKLQRFEEVLSTAISSKEMSDHATQLAGIMDDVLMALTASEMPEHKKHALVSKVIKNITADENGKLIMTFHPIAADVLCTAMLDNDVLSVEMRDVKGEEPAVENLTD